MLFDSGVFDQDPIEDFLQHYTLDTILEEIAKPASYQVDAFFGDIHAAGYQIDTRIFKPFASYLLDCMLVLDKNDPRFQESIINAMLWSYGRAFEELSEAISMMGLRLSLPYAVSDDLDLYWSKILGLKRRYGESDEDFLGRLSTRLAIMKSSGTRPECEAILDHILGLPGGSRLETYWPGDVRVCWNSYITMRTAQERYEAVKEALDDMIAAGVSWTTAFPWAAMQIATNIFGCHHTNFNIDTGLSGQKYHMYLLRTDLFDQGTISEDIDACLEEGHHAIHRIASHLIARPSKSQPIDTKLQGEVPVAQQYDAHIHKIGSKTASYDMISKKKKLDFYQADWLAERERRGFYLVATELVAA